MSTIRCDKCTYYAAYHHQKGQCRRNPPENTKFEHEDIGGYQMEYYHGDFPDVNACCWCGEFVENRGDLRYIRTDSDED